MSPPVAIADLTNGHDLPVQPPSTKEAAAPSKFPTPLVYSGSLDQYEHFDVTAVIGREYPTIQLSEIVKDDAKLRDLAITGMSLFIT